MKTRAWDGKHFRDDHFIDANGYVYQSWCLNSGHFTLSRVDWKLSRFTKLRDNDNQMVWEYDIYEHLGFKFVVRFHNGTFVLMHINGNVANQSIWVVRHLHKLGDIFTTPELLEEVK